MTQTGHTITDWFVLKTRPRQESRALDNLARQGFSAYCPWFLRKNGKKEALFPGYVFLPCYKSNMLGKIRSTRGVHGFIQFGGRVATISDQLIKIIKSQAIFHNNQPLFKQGQTVEFSDGPFASCKAVYLSERSHDRSIVLLQVLNSHRKIEVSTASLTSV